MPLMLHCLFSKGMEISSNVERVINVYQTDESTPPAFSRGYPASPIKGNIRTRILNVNYDAFKSTRGFRAHGAMAGDLQESVTRTFQNQMKFLITGNLIICD